AVTQSVRWHDHDPTELVGNLRGLSLFIASGDGTPGRYDAGKNPLSLAGAGAIEAGVSRMSHDFDHALTAAGIPHSTWFYGSGTLDVVTAPLYAAGRHYRVSGTGGDPKDAVANATGHLAFTVDLGPAHATQQTLFGPAAEQTFTHRQVTIRPS